MTEVCTRLRFLAWVVVVAKLVASAERWPWMDHHDDPLDEEKILEPAELDWCAQCERPRQMTCPACSDEKC